jgi:hypothetical protein
MAQLSSRMHLNFTAKPFDCIAVVMFISAGSTYDYVDEAVAGTDLVD